MTDLTRQTCWIVTKEHRDGTRYGVAIDLPTYRLRPRYRLFGRLVRNYLPYTRAHGGYDSQGFPYACQHPGYVFWGSRVEAEKLMGQLFRNPQEYNDTPTQY